jgi:DNA-binding NarL/FixJ family response regulator
MVTISIDRPDVLKARRLGARGYVVKGAIGPEIVWSLRSIRHGNRHVSPSVDAMLLSDINHRKSSLNHREDEILTLVMQGLSDKEISTKLFLSDKTVKQYMTSVSDGEAEPPRVWGLQFQDRKAQFH